MPLVILDTGTFNNPPGTAVSAGFATSAGQSLAASAVTSGSGSALAGLAAAGAYAAVNAGPSLIQSGMATAQASAFGSSVTPQQVYPSAALTSGAVLAAGVHGAGTPYPVTHGSQLTAANTGPWALQNVAQGSEVLLDISGQVAANNKVDTFPGDVAPPAWIPTSPYTYNNNPSNHGGILQSATVIDGWTVPAGTWVCQFCDFGGQAVEIQGDCAGAGTAWPGVLFRGCRMRGNYGAPGFFNQNRQHNDGTTWLTFCDCGGDEAWGWSGASGAPQYACNQILGDEGLGPPDTTIMIRCYMSYCVCFMQVNNSGDACIECFIENQLSWFDPSGPDAGYYHYNVYDVPGGTGLTANLFLRNNMSISPQPDSQPWVYTPTVGYQMSADDGAYNGGGTNIDGSTGYQVRDNYIGGMVYCFSFGVDKSNTQANVSNVTVTGNEFTTYWSEGGGSSGIAYKVCTFGSQGNVWSNNTWADDYGAGNWAGVSAGNSGRPYPSGNGPLAGTTISAPPPG